jgi:hypothetical protein
VASPAADAHQVDPDLAALLHDHYTDIATEHRASTQRIAAEAEQIPAREPAVLSGDFAFTEHLGARPTEVELAVHWARTVAEIHSYRATYGITDTTSALGDRPEDRTARGHFNTVHEDIAYYNEHVVAARDQQQREQHQQSSRAREHDIQAPIHVENERRGPRL